MTISLNIKYEFPVASDHHVFGVKKEGMVIASWYDPSLKTMKFLAEVKLASDKFAWEGTGNSVLKKPEGPGQWVAMQVIFSWSSLSRIGSGLRGGRVCEGTELELILPGLLSGSISDYPDRVYASRLGPLGVSLP